jgi:O-acetyl-ADP-ribose deacetylase (regulator of RNase III)
MGSISHIYGNIFDSKMQTIVNTVNCVGFMGGGIALEYKRRYPDMFKEYKERCLNGTLKMGELHLWNNDEPWILNFPTKIHFKDPSKEEFIEKGLKKFVSNYKKHSIESIAFPQLGTQLGGLDWENRVKPIMYKYLEALDIEVEIYEFDKNADDSLYLNLRNILQKFSNEDFKTYLDIGKKTSDNLMQNLDIRIKSMRDIEYVPGIGEKALEKIYLIAKQDIDNFGNTEDIQFEQDKLKFDE